MNRAVPQPIQPLYRPRPEPVVTNEQVQETQASNVANLYQPQMPNANNSVCDNQCNCQYRLAHVPVFVPPPVMYVPEVFQHQSILNVFLPQYGIVNFVSRNAPDNESVAVNSSDTESAFSEDDYEDEQDVRQLSFSEHPLNFAMSRPTGAEYNFHIDYNAQNANLHFQSTRF